MSEEKPMSNMAKRIIELTVKNEPNYPPGVARNFGYIESVIDRGFSENIAAEDVVQEIQDALDRITNILALPSVLKSIERNKNGK